MNEIDKSKQPNPETSHAQDATKTSEFEFDAPTFTDFNALCKEDGNSLEDYCQNYFDRKSEESASKRASLELGLKESTSTAMNIDDDNDDDQDNANADSDEQGSNGPIKNLLTATDFANTSSTSAASVHSHRSKRSHESQSLLSHLHPLSQKINKNRHNLSTEELQLRKIEQKKTEFDRLKELNAKNVAKMKEDHRVFHPIRSTKLTIPMTPALRTTARAQQRCRKENIAPAAHAQAPPPPRPKTCISHNKTRSRKRKTSCVVLADTPSISNVAGDDASRPATADVAQPAVVQQPLRAKIRQVRQRTARTRRRASHVVVSADAGKKPPPPAPAHVQPPPQPFQARKINPKIFKANAANLGILNNVKHKTTTTTAVKPFSFLTERRAQKYNETHHTNTDTSS